MKTWMSIFCIATALFGCASKQSGSSQEEAFKKYQEVFFVDLWQHYPEWATYVGFHRFDSLLTIPNEGSRQLQLSFAERHLDSLRHFDTTLLTAESQIDLHLLQNFLESTVWSLTEERAYEWDPSGYNVSELIAIMLGAHSAPLEDRLRTIGKRMEKIPIYYEAAKGQIRQPADVLVQLAIRQNEGGLSVFESDLADSIGKSTLPEEEKAALLLASRRSIGAINGFVRFLKEYPNRNPRSFRYGKDLYEHKFRFDIQSEYTASQIYDSAVARKHDLHREMAQLSRQLWPKYFGTQSMPADTLTLIRKVIDTLSVYHVRPEEFQSAIEQQLPELWSFVKEKNLLSMDESKPLVVRKEPGYLAGIAGASISAPGPYDSDGNTYYNVGSLAGWPAEKAESYLREYNHYILQILNIHEAIPGHYTQLVYANKTPSLVKSIFANGAMIEGWAVYTEQMMLENGYGNQEPEMWLMWYKWHLRTVCNTILDYSVHVKDMSEEDAMDLLVNQAFQQRAEAEGKWHRVQVSRVQLTSYFTGYKEIIELRKQLQAKQGRAFDLKSFHEQFLSHGSSPVKYIKRLMLAME